MKKFIKKSGFTLAEILITLGVLGSIAAITLPSLMLNYKGKVLEESFITTYNDMKKISTEMNGLYGDISERAQRETFFTTDFVSFVKGMTSVTKGSSSSTSISEKYRKLGARTSPAKFDASGGRLSVGNSFCNSELYTDIKGRLWSYHPDNKIICVDINGTNEPNRLNIDIFAYRPFSAIEMANITGSSIYDVSSEILLCDMAEGSIFSSGTDMKTLCPYTAPVDNVPPAGTTTSSMGREINQNQTYWREYIDYQNK